MPTFDTATIDKQHVIQCSFSFCINGRKTHNLCKNPIKKTRFYDRKRGLTKIRFEHTYFGYLNLTTSI